jgi:hypothetical protein
MKEEVILRIWCKNHWIWSYGWKDGEFLIFGGYFVNFPGARDISEIIFQILGA